MNEAAVRGPLSARILARFALVTGGLTVVGPLVIPRIAGQSFPMSTTVIWVVLGTASLISGFFGLRRAPVGFWLLFVIFLAQAVEYFSPTFYFSFVGPFALKVGWGWYSPATRVNVNVVAVVVCFFAFRAARAVAQPELPQ
jgi:hypothetical protein